tara:strand:+ start:799 stop:1038 length:240 start_codon:yes stop_codon:yes gene_type:complete
MAEQINEYTPTSATSITIKKPCCDPFTGEWGYTELDYSINEMEVQVNEDGEAHLVVFSVNSLNYIPIKLDMETSLPTNK